MQSFIPGKLYKLKKDQSFPDGGGLRNTLFYKSGKQIENPYNINSDDIMLVLELLYTQRYRKRMRLGMEEPETIYMWHMKVMINDQLGYVSQWEGQWEELS